MGDAFFQRLVVNGFFAAVNVFRNRYKEVDLADDQAEILELR